MFRRKDAPRRLTLGIVLLLHFFVPLNVEAVISAHPKKRRTARVNRVSDGTSKMPVKENSSLNISGHFFNTYLLNNTA
jgi:hypothetical protein